MAFDYSQNNTSNNISWPNGGHQKRKIGESDFEEQSRPKMFLTEEKLVKYMQTLSLDLCADNSSSNIEDSKNDDEEMRSSSVEFHRLLKDNIKNDDLQDQFINKLYDFERRKLCMQIVPYMPIHPSQLNKNSNSNEKKEEKRSLTPPVQTNDHLFKKPFLPTPYTVEEPCDNITKRSSRMKRSYSQSIRSNSNLSFVELPNDTSNQPSSTDYLIFEPSTPCTFESSNNNIKTVYLPNRPSIRITEYFDFVPTSSNLTDDINIQSIHLSDKFDNMDDDN